MQHEQPLIWVLQGMRAGDNAQARALAREIGGRVEIKQLGFNALHQLPNFILGGTRNTLTHATSRKLVPPWPDVVVAVGKRAAPVSLWIKASSGGKTKAIHIGRPRYRLDAFDLVLTTPQYGLPAADNLIELTLPFVDAPDIDKESLQAWQTRWSQFPRPWIVAAIGAQKYPQLMRPQDLAKFGTALDDFANSFRGSVLLFSSPRSESSAIESVAQKLTCGVWRSDTAPTSQNSYAAALASGDAFAVTSDSVSMIAEMVHTGRATHVFQLPTARVSIPSGLLSGTRKFLAGRGLLQQPRNVSGLMKRLIQDGVVSDIMNGATLTPGGFESHAERQRAITLIREMLRQ